MNRKAVLFMVLATALWGGHYVLGGVAVQSMTPIDLTYLRWLLAAVPLVVVAQLVEKPDWRAVLRAWPRLLILAMLGMVAYNLFLYQALTITTPVGASLVNAANPATMALIATFLAREKLRTRGAVGIAISLIGVVVVLTNGSLTTLFGLDFNAGQLLMVGAIVVWSLYSIWGRVDGVPPITSTAAQAVIVVIVMTPVALMSGVQFPTEPSAISALLYIAIFPSIGSYVLWNMAMRTTPAPVAGIYLNLITVFTVAIGVVVGQPFSSTDLLGGIIVITGVIITSAPASLWQRWQRTPDDTQPVLPEPAVARLESSRSA